MDKLSSALQLKVINCIPGLKVQNTRRHVNGTNQL
jgi:hypothetical protein